MAGIESVYKVDSRLSEVNGKCFAQENLNYGNFYGKLFLKNCIKCKYNYNIREIIVIINRKNSNVILTSLVLRVFGILID